MRFTTLSFLSCLMTAASAHFVLQYPPARGDFSDDDEPTFCDGYADSTTNRSSFPTGKGGFISIESHHEQWTLGGIVATVQNANSFDVFRDNSSNFQMFLPFFGTSGEGAFCVDVDLSASGVAGVKNGANVTLQFIFDGGDGNLYQCADLTLSDTFEIPSDVSCKNATKNGATQISSSLTGSQTMSMSSTSSTPLPTSSGSSAGRNAAAGMSGLAALVGAAVAFL
ncbi:uncharacterized protein BXZ73DRAFT_79770 [Epithele typhae]|uniref:uncharacterized protein n=1 Tax=Epithele typhae TaxID=378194 RepID=UPI002007A967|nr:uncharacterized protein BXZ73DRAFT_79770 [Epithele typhae]KAH9921950.1 hypothetical protein BXZ73DRAFT_79770 [Epithele typhae]